MAGPTLNASEKNLINTALPGSTIHSSTIARLYKAKGSVWEYSGTGAAVIVTERASNKSFLKHVSLQKKSVTLTHEVSKGFDYHKAREYFHTFELEDCVAGFSFADEGEAGDFYKEVHRVLSGGSSPAPSASHSTPSNSSVPALAISSPTLVSGPGAHSAASSPLSPRGGSVDTPRTADKKKAASGWGFKKLLGFDKEPEGDLVVSEPRNFRHESSIGWNPDTGFEIRNIPPEWRKLFQAAGIKKSELRNKETAAFVMKTIEQNGGFELMGGGGAENSSPAPASPPPAPSPSSSAPPPRPSASSTSSPSHSHSTGPPPPPPPSRSGPPPPPPPSGPRPPRFPVAAPSHSTPAQHAEQAEEEAAGGDYGEQDMSSPPPPPPPSGSTPKLNLAGGGGRAGLLGEIQAGKALRNVTSDNAPPPTPRALAQGGGGGVKAGDLVSTLAAAMDARRAAIKEVDEADDDGWDDDDDW